MDSLAQKILSRQKMLEEVKNDYEDRDERHPKLRIRHLGRRYAGAHGIQIPAVVQERSWRC
jgi:hypothetical protein